MYKFKILIHMTRDEGNKAQNLAELIIITMRQFDCLIIITGIPLFCSTT